MHLTVLNLDNTLLNKQNNNADPCNLALVLNRFLCLSQGWEKHNHQTPKGSESGSHKVCIHGLILRRIIHQK